MRKNGNFSIFQLLKKYFRYVESHKKLELNQEPNVDYLGHPINGYNLIKHAAMGWKNFHFKINPHLNETIANLDYMQVSSVGEF